MRLASPGLPGCASAVRKKHTLAWGQTVAPRQRRIRAGVSVTPGRRAPGRRALRAGFTLVELMVVIAIIAVIVALVAPGLSRATRDLELQRAKSNIFAALQVARSRAVRDRTLVALHVFRDSEAYRVPHPDSQRPVADRSRFDLRWGGLFSEDSANFTHAPTGKMMLRMEIPNVLHRDTSTNAVEFFWPADHDPVVLPDFVGVARPGTELDLMVDISAEFAASAGTVTVPFYEDFYIVFGEDGKLATVLVDYNIYYDDTNDTTRRDNSAPVLEAKDGTTRPTYSASGLCIYDMEKFKALPDNSARYDYINRADNRVVISPYTGLPMELEAAP